MRRRKQTIISSTNQSATNSAPGPPSNLPPSRPEIVDLAQLLYDHIEGQISRADIKAQLIVAADAILAAAVTNLGKGATRVLFDDRASVLTRLLALYTIAMFAALLASFVYALLVVMPKLDSAGNKGLAFFGDIARDTQSGFASSFAEQSSEAIRDNLVAEIYVKSKIAVGKYAGVRVSVFFLFGALILWGLVEVIQSLLLSST